MRAAGLMVGGLRISRRLRQRMNARRFELREQKRWRRQHGHRPPTSPVIPMTSLVDWLRRLTGMPTSETKRGGDSL